MGGCTKQYCKLHVGIDSCANKGPDNCWNISTAVNADAVRETLVTGQVCYWSRSRKALWRKGEQSGQVQMLKEFRWDCDADTILVQVDQTGVACHTGRHNCFFNAVRDGEIQVIADVEIDPATLYEK